MQESYKPKKAVGLRYRHGEDERPHVVARGEGIIAEEILRIAREEGIPVKKDTGLVDSLLRLDYMQDIPEELFVMVAEILVFAYETMGREIDGTSSGEK
ncbi:MAG: EscU/YscU/HrcU family type III secretion system export apparatus switch protein [Acidobacteriota bacterium]|nr:EscU/YscU/HrcU family type III secretion system export apparatus switch protein [Acidobacteriota bacterium]